MNLRVRRIGRAYAFWVVRLRWFVVAFWLAVVVISVWLLPGLGGEGQNLSQFTSSSIPAIQAEQRSTQTFGFPLLSRVAVVQRDAAGLTPDIQARALLRALSIDRKQYPDVAQIAAAVPIANTFGLFPGAHESGTTVITFLFIPSDVGFDEQLAEAQRLVDGHFDGSDHVVGVAGSVPARAEQARLLNSQLLLVEVATIVTVFLIVAVAFRSLIAPVLTLTVVGVAITVTLHVAGFISRALAVPVPAETRSLLVALLVGVGTDYVVFYLLAMRRALATGTPRFAAAEQAAARFTSVVAIAGMTVAAGTGALLVARSAVFRAFGPAMALAVLIGMLAALTLVPALLGVLGSVVFWPRRPSPPPPDKPDRSSTAASGKRWSRWLSHRRAAALVLGVCLVGLLLAASPLRHLSLGASFSSSLPAGNPVREASEQAMKGFAGGILSPTELIVRAPNVASRTPALNALQARLAAQAGVAGVVGPEDEPSGARLGLLRSPDGSAARYLLILTDDPLGARAIETLARIQQQLPEELSAVGLSDATPSLAGDTAIVKSAVDQARADFGRIAGVALLANIAILMLYLRALVAPLLLVATSVLGIAATFGVTALLFSRARAEDGFTFYVPFAVAVLLLSLGSDYNIFAVGQVWREAETRPLGEAIAVAIPRSAQAIRTAGITLAVSFGLLALIPLRPFREVAFAMSLGILLDVLVLRPLVVPSLLILVGPASSWPGHRLGRRASAPTDR